MDEPVNKEGPFVTLKQGQLRGLFGRDISGNQFEMFLGIPFAKPPVGRLRFKPPEPAEGWEGVRDCTKEGNSCLSVDMLSRKMCGSEDCLYLNVFTKELPGPGVKPKPVMVYFHGGGFTTGSATPLIHGPNHLLAEDIVLVTVNYRLGIFGFLNSDDANLKIPGNAAFKDQVLALEWVKENINTFNGDPNNVCIFGISAGGASVDFHIVSPRSSGLFHKAISQSGSLLNPWAWGTRNNILLVAEKLQKNPKSEKEALDVLMETSSRDLLLMSLEIPDNMFTAEKRRPFGPVIEKPNPTAFLIQNPKTLLKTGQFNHAPMMKGCTSNEGLISECDASPPDVLRNYEDLPPIWYLDADKGTPNYEELKSMIANFYFKDGYTAEAKHKLIGDIGFICGIMDFTKLAAKNSKCPVYLYVFSYELEASRYFLRAIGIKDTGMKGVCHGGDQPFIFSSDFVKTMTDGDPKVFEDAMEGIKTVTKIWADFARHGNPHKDWKPVTEDELSYFEIRDNPRLKRNPFYERLKFWERVYKTVSEIDITRMKSN